MPYREDSTPLAYHTYIRFTPMQMTVSRIVVRIHSIIWKIPANLIAVSKTALAYSPLTEITLGPTQINFLDESEYILLADTQQIN